MLNSKNSNAAMMGYKFSLQSTHFPSLLQSNHLFHEQEDKTNLPSLLFKDSNKQSNERKSMELIGLNCCCAERPPAYNPLIHKLNFSSSINQHKPTHSLVCGLMKKEEKEREEKRRNGGPLKLKKRWVMSRRLL